MSNLPQILLQPPDADDLSGVPTISIPDTCEMGLMDPQVAAMLGAGVTDMAAGVTEITSGVTADVPSTGGNSYITVKNPIQMAQSSLQVVDRCQ